MKRAYGELLLSLSQNWNVHAFWFDWRKDLNIAGDELAAQISGWFGPDAPVHIVAHSMGGLAARTFIKNHRKRWNTMWDKKSDGKLGGRLVMLGTPNHGSFTIPQVITGLEGMVRKLAAVDCQHSVAELLPILNTFVGSYQMLPSPQIDKRWEALYKSETYGDLQVPQTHLDNARQYKDFLAEVIDPGRMVYVAGYNQPTFCDVDISRVKNEDAYEATKRGDGRVPHQLGFLDGVKNYFVDESHGDLPANGKVQAALDDLLETGECSNLEDKIPATLRALKENSSALRQEIKTRQEQDASELAAFVGRLSSRRNLEPAVTLQTMAQERKLEEQLTREVLPFHDEAKNTLAREQFSMRPGRIKLAVVIGSIEDIDESGLKDRPIDAISVGHYIGVKPQYAELALDIAISAALPGRKLGTDGKLRERDLILTQYAERGIIRGELGQPFFLNDPRVPHNARQGGRLIAIAGMGISGRFGSPELTVLARELCWSLSRLGKRHLATVLIGAGAGNLSIQDAVNGWIRGIKNAIASCADDENQNPVRVTFFEQDPKKVREIQNAIQHEKKRLEDKNRLLIDFEPIPDTDIAQAEKKAEKEAAKKRVFPPPAPDSRPVPTRITLALERKTYRFAAITENASVPERAIPVDPELITQANDELAGETNPILQLERGQFLERLLVPRDLRGHMFGKAPLVMMLDATTARIHWEMVAQFDQTNPVSDDDAFLGRSRGFTRQLRTQFAPPPEPPPPPRRLLRVLVVADPAEDASLPGALEEGADVADLFETFNQVYQHTENRVEVVRLFGPREATRTNVLRELMLRSYDVLHFSGHCYFDEEEPSESGWIFNAGRNERLTAKELNRIDRIPRFVFSNACESGITPDRQRSDKLAPSFAEAFFERGVINFVCTAWPVEDMAARHFASRVYSGLLGLKQLEDSRLRYGSKEPELMFEAMREARRAIALTAAG
ncbi:MAG TPA: CHAT domain-containing protein, partial [Verrucomicrobiae bacterium]|nr:CHAT domain-containing protein [Verrucomicrobiae bacterium]